MNEYINRDLAYKLIKEQREKETGAYSKGRNKGLIIAGSIINNKEVLPTADVVEVVRCKDCNKTIGQSLTGEKLCCVHEIAVPDNYYCASGERRDT